MGETPAKWHRFVGLQLSQMWWNGPLILLNHATYWLNNNFHWLQNRYPLSVAGHHNAVKQESSSWFPNTVMSLFCPHIIQHSPRLSGGHDAGGQSMTGMALTSGPRLTQGSDDRLQEISDIINHLPKHFGLSCTKQQPWCKTHYCVMGDN